MKDQIKFDTTNAGTITDSDKVLSGVISTDGSTLITDTLDGGKQGLDVFVINSITTTAGAEKAEDTAHTTGDTGNFILAVANHTEGALHSADGDYSALQVDDTGRLRVVADLDSTNLSEKAEDAAHTTGDIGSFTLGVRQDTLASSTTTDGDYAAFKQNSKGEQYVIDTDGNALLTTIDADTGSISTDTAAMVVDLAAIEVLLTGIDVDTDSIATTNTSIDGTLTALSKAEDAAHVTGDQGIQVLAVRNDTPGALAGTDGDYGSLQLDATGNLRVSGTFVGGAEHAEDAAHVSGDTGSFSLAVRNDTKSALATTDGDYIPFQMNASGELYTVDEAGNVLLGTIDADTSSIAVDTAAMVVDLAAIEVLLTGIDVDTDAINTATTAIETYFIAEDAAAAGGEKGIQTLAVRQDTLASSVSADGDFGSLKLNSVGRLYVEAEIGTDPSVANTAVTAAATSVLATATDLKATDLADRKFIAVYNNGNKKIFVGGSGVTTAAGYPVSPGSAMELRAGAAIDLYAISSTAGQDTRVLELS